MNKLENALRDWHLIRANYFRKEREEKKMKKKHIAILSREILEWGKEGYENIKAYKDEETAEKIARELNGLLYACFKRYFFRTLLICLKILIMKQQQI